MHLQDLQGQQSILGFQEKARVQRYSDTVYPLGGSMNGGMVEE